MFFSLLSQIVMDEITGVETNADGVITYGRSLKTNFKLKENFRSDILHDFSKQFVKKVILIKFRKKIFFFNYTVIGRTYHSNKIMLKETKKLMNCTFPCTSRSRTLKMILSA